MKLLQLGWPAWLAGWALLAGLLFLLQRLRVRHRPMVVPTTLFWQEAQEEARARTLLERFRHPLAYLLALCIAGLAWLAFADPVWKDSRGVRTTILFDGSSAMARTDRFAAAQKQVAELVRNLPRQRTEVIWCGASPVTLLAAGEDRSLLRLRLQGLTPEAVPASTGQALALFAASRGIGMEAAETRVIVIGEAPSASADLPQDLEWMHLPVLPEGASASDSAIAALGISAAAESWGQVDALLCVVDGDGNADTPVVTLGGETWKGTVLRSAVDNGSQYLIRGLPAEGGMLSVELPALDANPANNRASLRLPVRAPIRIAIGQDVHHQALEQVLAADPAFEIVSDPSQAEVRILGNAAETSSTPALRWVASEAQREAIVLQHENGLDSDDVLAFALGEFGLDRIDTTEMANRAGRPIELAAHSGPTRELRIWAELLDPERYSLVESRAFPVLIGRSLRWLAQQAPLVPYVAAGSVLPMPLASFASGFAPPEELLPLRAGEFVGPDGQRWQAGLLAPWNNAPWNAAAPSSTDGLPSRAWSLFPLLLLLALVLVSVEWVLYGSGRIP